MASLVKGLIDAGIHYGHRTAGWNPKMEPYIYGKKNGIHIIDVRQTIKGLLLAKRFITRSVADGKEVLFVGTKRQARPAVESACEEAGMPFVTERWLGGTLTNFRTIRSRLKRLEELEELMNSEEWENYSKKMGSQLVRERKKIDRNLGGIRTLDRVPGALVVIDVRREINAIREARTLGIPTVCLLDTDGDPDLVDLPIPGNDDAMRAIELIVKELTGAAQEGKTARAQQQKASEESEEDEGEGEKPRRRSTRAQFRAGESVDSPAAGEEAMDESPELGGSASRVRPEPTGEDVAERAPRAAQEPEAEREGAGLASERPSPPDTGVPGVGGGATMGGPADASGAADETAPVGSTDDELPPEPPTTQAGGDADASEEASSQGGTSAESETDTTAQQQQAGAQSRS